MDSLSKKARPTLRVRLTPRAESIVRKGHPWVFDQSIKSRNRDAEAGELAVIFDRNNQFLAIGLYDPESPIRIRVLHRGKPVPIDDRWWAGQLEKAVARRETVLHPDTDGLRWIHGECDGWPGLVLDQYAGVLVLKLYTPAWFPHLPAIQQLLADRLQPASIVLRLSRNIQERAATLGLREGRVLHGEPVEKPVVFRESGIHFLADVLKGQKTGFFLDQRDNRRKVETLASGKRVLNLFSFSGGFSLYAARGGARHVTSIDISHHALAELKENWDLNDGDHRIRTVPHNEIQADVFEWLRTSRDDYGLIVLDPPSLAKREQDREGAIQAYQQLTADAIQRLEKGGTLVTASCSAHVSKDEFVRAVRAACTTSGRRFEELAVTGSAPDHPDTLPEMTYLKTVYLRDISRP
jgi:23S rRNA (cytosine1962-C5)-methyltransferase